MNRYNSNVNRLKLEYYAVYYYWSLELNDFAYQDVHAHVRGRMKSRGRVREEKYLHRQIISEHVILGTKVRSTKKDLPICMK